MALRCANCDSLFFKTLEMRSVSATVLLHKKRCKRCKYKYLLRQDLPGGVMRPISQEEWLSGQKLANRISDRARVFTGEYTSRISRAAEDHAAYLERIKRAEDIRDEWKKTSS